MSHGTLPATGPRPTAEPVSDAALDLLATVMPRTAARRRHDQADAEPPGCPGCRFCAGPAEPEPLPEVEREARQDLIRRHLGQFADAAAAMRRFGRDVTSWTLPASWDPGPAPESFVASTYEVAAREAVKSRLLGRPLTFAGDRIVLHLDPAGPGEPDRLERKP